MSSSLDASSSSAPYQDDDKLMDILTSANNLNTEQQQMYPSSSPAASAPASAPSTSCMNCGTAKTPLWRRDENGSVLCNACGLFLKLHGRPRPISLKTDVIKSRNRVKTMRPDMQMKKKQNQNTNPVDPHGLNVQSHDAATTAAALAAVRQTSQKTNGHGDNSHSPVSRTGTPALMYDNMHMYHNGMEPHHFQSPALPQYPMPNGSPGRPASPMNGEHHVEITQTHEQLLAANSSLKTRVSELEVINELYRGRLSQLEQDQQNSDNYHHQAEMATREQAETQRKLDEKTRQLEDSHRRENILKRRLDEMEMELELKNNTGRVDDKLDDNMDHTMDDQVDGKVDDKVDDKVDNKLEDKTDDKVDGKVDDKVDDTVGDKTDDKMDDKVDDRLLDNKLLDDKLLDQKLLDDDVNGDMNNEAEEPPAKRTKLDDKADGSEYVSTPQSAS